MIIIPAPPSKSQTHRAFILAALAPGVSRVLRPLESDDTQRTRDCLTALGARIHPIEGGYRVEAIAQTRPTHPVELAVGESGTTCRLITAVAAALPGTYRISGEGRMHLRPIAPLTDALERLGVGVHFEGAPGCPPLRLTSRGFLQSHTTLDVAESSQYLSALLLAAPLSPQGLTVDITSAAIASWPYAHLTLEAMHHAGVPVTISEREGKGFVPRAPEEVPGLSAPTLRFCVPAGHSYRAGDFLVEGDWSSASYFLAAGALGRVPVAVTGLRSQSLQADRALVDILNTMGGRVEVHEDRVTAYPSRLRGAELSMGACPDIVPTVAMLAAAAHGTTRIRDAAHLRLKESDRIAAVVDGLTRLGVCAQPTSDGMIIHGGIQNTSPVELATFGDHRLAMSLCLAELLGARPMLDTPGCVAKSFPHFWELWETVRRANAEERRA
ncbi:MAG: 3-phosphoshikimate 1-carboxyvinyltransferase [Desulfomicrobiaceae bacterium]|nr:3-phosphoshikimate 1-carboxyvinyltransferase [Desulfomicrobiaceae bacterium]